jgi:hypothetical protein
MYVIIHTGTVKQKELQLFNLTSLTPHILHTMTRAWSAHEADACPLLRGLLKVVEVRGGTREMDQSAVRRRRSQVTRRWGIQPCGP